MTIDRFQLQLTVTAKEDLLTEIFRTAFNYVDADQGFLAFIDPQDHLRILVQKGEYWHLPADRGVSGVAFQTGQTQIEEPRSGTGPFRESGSESAVRSEIAVPVSLRGESVGILLFDSLREGKRFEDREQQYLEKEVTKIGEALDNEDPWSFRSWWAQEQRKRREYLLAATKAQLKGSLRDRFARHSDLDIKIAEVDEHGLAGSYVALLERVDSAAYGGHDDERDPLYQAIVRGRARIVGEAIPQYRCYIPFPLVGPVVGVIKLESGDKELLSEETVGIIEAELEKLAFDPLSVTVDDRVNDRFYLNFIHSALTAHLSGLSLIQTLQRIADQATRLCGSDVSIYVVENALKALLAGARTEHRLHLIARDELLASHLPGIEPGASPDRLYYTDLEIVSPIVNRETDLLGAVSVRRGSEGLEEKFNVQVIETTSLLVNEVVENMWMRHRSSHTVPERTGQRHSRVQVAHLSKPQKLRSLNEGKEALDWLARKERISLEDFQVVGKFVVADPQARSALALATDQLKKTALSEAKSPYPVLLCAPPGAGKTFFVKEFARSLTDPSASTEKIHLAYADLASATDITATLRRHFKEILVAPSPRIALLDEVDTTVKGENAYRFLLRAIEGNEVDLGDGASARLPGAIWFFAASNAHNLKAFEDGLAASEKGPDFLRRFRQDGTIVELPVMRDAREFVCQAVANALSFQPDLKSIQASVLYYFAVSAWEDAGSLRAAVRTALQDLGTGDILKLSVIADRPDYVRFMEIHHDAIETLTPRLVRCSK